MLVISPFAISEVCSVKSICSCFGDNTIERLCIYQNIALKSKSKYSDQGIWVIIITYLTHNEWLQDAISHTKHLVAMGWLFQQLFVYLVANINVDQCHNSISITGLYNIDKLLESSVQFFIDKKLLNTEQMLDKHI